LQLLHPSLHILWRQTLVVVIVTIGSIGSRSATTAQKLRGTKVCPFKACPSQHPGRTGRICRFEGPGVSPLKICANSDAKSCILVTTCCEISYFLKIRPRSWGTDTLLVPQPKTWGTSLPRSLQLLRLWLGAVVLIGVVAVLSNLQCLRVFACSND